MSSTKLVSADTANLLARARHFANVGDQWLVSVGRAFVRSADRVGAEATVVASSAEKAANTTMRVSRGLMGVLSHKMTVRVRRVRESSAPPPRPSGEREVAQLVDQVASVAKAHATTIASLPHSKLDTLVSSVCTRLADELGALASAAELESGQVRGAAFAAAPVVDAAVMSSEGRQLASDARKVGEPQQVQAADGPEPPTGVFRRDTREGAPELLAHEDWALAGDRAEAAPADDVRTKEEPSEG
ncbi:MAG: hypothetical protein MUF54_11195 [Polyangiaceae bacterium]|nr:hypothetical protein [Polyangiaceae bacterium]